MVCPRQVPTGCERCSLGGARREWASRSIFGRALGENNKKLYEARGVSFVFLRRLQGQQGTRARPAPTSQCTRVSETVGTASASASLQYVRAASQKSRPAQRSIHSSIPPSLHSLTRSLIHSFIPNYPVNAIWLRWLLISSSLHSRLWCQHTRYDMISAGGMALAEPYLLTEDHTAVVPIAFLPHNPKLSFILPTGCPKLPHCLTYEYMFRIHPSHGRPFRQPAQFAPPSPSLQERRSVQHSILRDKSLGLCSAALPCLASKSHQRLSPVPNCVPPAAFPQACSSLPGWPRSHLFLIGLDQPLLLQ
jgi:hypothetical protein